MAEESSNKYVLVLPSWYPSRIDRFNGDFNERLVRAIASHYEQVVLYVIKDASINKVEHEVTHSENMTTFRVYYPGLKDNLFNKLYTVWQYLRLNQKFIKEIIALRGRPELVHCYVFYPAMISALFTKKRVGSPIILTEHWTAFYKENLQSLCKAGFIKKALYKYLIRSATHIIPVARRLGDEMKRWAPYTRQTIIPNVVDVSLFNFKEEKQFGDTFTLLHVSTMKYQKNTDGLLRAFEKSIRAGINAELLLVGELPDAIQHQINASPILTKRTKVYGEIEYFQVAELMSMSDCLLMFSRYENLPCVILEALCCGLPVIATRVGGIEEVIDPSNGILIDSEDEEAFAMAIVEMHKNYSTFNKAAISKKAISTFSYPAIANQVCAVYASVLERKAPDNFGS